MHVQCTCIYPLKHSTIKSCTCLIRPPSPAFMHAHICSHPDILRATISSFIHPIIYGIHPFIHTFCIPIHAAIHIPSQASTHAAIHSSSIMYHIICSHTHSCSLSYTMPDIFPCRQSCGYPFIAN